MREDQNASKAKKRKLESTIEEIVKMREIRETCKAKNRRLESPIEKKTTQLKPARTGNKTSGKQVGAGNPVSNKIKN